MTYDYQKKCQYFPSRDVPDSLLTSPVASFNYFSLVGALPPPWPPLSQGCVLPRLQELWPLRCCREPVDCWSSCQYCSPSRVHAVCVLPKRAREALTDPHLSPAPSLEAESSTAVPLQYVYKWVYSPTPTPNLKVNHSFCSYWARRKHTHTHTHTLS